MKFKKKTADGSLPPKLGRDALHSYIWYQKRRDALHSYIWYQKCRDALHSYIWYQKCRDALHSYIWYQKCRDALYSFPGHLNLAVPRHSPIWAVTRYTPTTTTWYLPPQRGILATTHIVTHFKGAWPYCILPIRWHDIRRQRLCYFSSYSCFTFSCF